MAKRWVYGSLLGVLVACSLPAMAWAQSADPMPIGRSSVVQTVAPPGTPYPPAQNGMGAACPTVPGFQPLMKPPGASVPNLTGCPPEPLPDCNFEDDDHLHVFLSGSYMLIQRQRMKEHTLGVVDPFVVDDNLPAPPGSPVVLTFRNVDQPFRTGYRLAVGVYQQDWMAEATGFYIGSHTNDKLVVRPGQLDSFFYNPPVGFEGTGFTGGNQSALWDNADIMDLRFRWSMLNVELNCKCFAGGGDCGESVEAYGLLGVRFVDLPEHLRFHTEDDTLQLGPIPETVADYFVDTHNRLLGPQIGGGLTWQLTECFAWGIETKAALCANYVEMNTKLARGDGLIGFDGGRSKWGISTLTDSTIHLDLNGSWWQLRVGYNIMWFWGMAAAEDQLDFNLANTNGRGDTEGSIFFHGLQASLNLIF